MCGGLGSVLEPMPWGGNPKEESQPYCTDIEHLNEVLALPLTRQETEDDSLNLLPKPVDSATTSPFRRCPPPLHTRQLLSQYIVRILDNASNRSTANNCLCSYWTVSEPFPLTGHSCINFSIFFLESAEFFWIDLQIERQALD